MAYMSNRLIARPAYSGLSGVWDSIKDNLGKAVDYYGQAEQAKGAAAALSTQQQAAFYASQNSGPSMGTIVLLGAAGVGLLLILKHKKKHP